ncbi:competence damage-inducible protein A [Spirochaetia bacterium]|nr:competence damage-inducible protein A [Spirochaetia bacterium]
MAEDPAERSTCGLELTACEMAKSLILELRERSQTLALAESCTAGLVADLLAGVPGASQVLWGSFVCYTAVAKCAMLGLDRQRLEQYGLVSVETACDMALGALAKSGASLAAAITGLAGPDGDGSAVPVGTVWVATARRGSTNALPREFHFQGSRNEVRMQAALAALEELLARDRILDKLRGN